MKSNKKNKLPISHYLSTDVVDLAKSFLGTELHTRYNGAHTAGIIVETEAYCGATDAACHAYPDRRTPRTATMYKGGGIAYVYLIYGMYNLFNIVTNESGFADAVLVRAIEPLIGLEEMKERRGVNKENKLLSGGPGRLSQALGIGLNDDGEDLTGDRIWLAPGNQISDDAIEVSTRIGVESCGEDALLPWRFHIRGNKYVSK